MVKNPKVKGGNFERATCKKLSLWITQGERQDVLWRSAMSGGRATVHHRKGVSIRQAGDIAAVGAEGHEFCDRFFVECKAYKDLQISSFLLKGKGNLAKFWKTTRKQAAKHHKLPMLIAKENNTPILVVADVGELKRWADVNPLLTSQIYDCDISLFTDLLISKREA